MYSVARSPDISIVIPVYNVASCLAECLDSVIGQTMRNLQIICVDDGATDRSPAILDEYAAKDARIMVVHKQNGGVSSARNAAYPLIRGKYTLFVDGDDSIEPTLCEKTFSVAEREQAEMIFFLYQATSETDYTTPFELFLRDRDLSEMDFKTLLSQMTPWSKLWKTSFLCEHDILFPEEISLGEDAAVHWKALLQNPRMAVVPEKLYWYRYNPMSLSRDGNNTRMFDIIHCYDYIKEICRNASTLPPRAKETFLMEKLSSIYHWYDNVSFAHKARMRELIKATVNDDEKAYFSDMRQPLHPVVRAFYRYLDRPNWWNTSKYKTYRFLVGVKRTLLGVKRKWFGGLRFQKRPTSFRP